MKQLSVVLYTFLSIPFHAYPCQQKKNQKVKKNLIRRGSVGYIRNFAKDNDPVPLPQILALALAHLF